MLGPCLNGRRICNDGQTNGRMFCCTELYLRDYYPLFEEVKQGGRASSVFLFFRLCFFPQKTKNSEPIEVRLLLLLWEGG